MNRSENCKVEEQAKNYSQPFHNASMSLDANKSNAAIVYNQPTIDKKNMHLEYKSDDIEMYVENMLNELKGKMQNLSNNLLSKVENMEKSLEDLETAMLNFSNQTDT
ncbi:heat shock factor-binding protein 1 [Plasmodium gonderi]|uniref:Heat shock factor-binding protein 1 n=1 Tax=Plasmodium gonderi TaxID=77519 RepID=A0A1Y1JIF2_PLAGO|nr:heat shock factor-binding protein 1 [Plasmodium gonderi]GAW80977.1 heat shock factor-binding protein 1 [Plasmodium gonderi]